MLFVGSGISCTAVMLNLLDKLEVDNLPGGDLFNIAIIEKDAEFWKGIPYGSRSSVNSLTITNFGEFVPNMEKEPFIAWLEKDREQWIDNLKKAGGATATKWFEYNLAQIQSGQWDEIYIPRSLFGEYLNEKIEAKIVNALRNKTARVTYIQGLVVDVNKDDSAGYQIKVMDNTGRDLWLQTNKLVLSIGSPPL